VTSKVTGQEENGSKDKWHCELDRVEAAKTKRSINYEENKANESSNFLLTCHVHDSLVKKTTRKIVGKKLYGN